MFENNEIELSYADERWRFLKKRCCNLVINIVQRGSHGALCNVKYIGGNVSDIEIR